MIAEAKINHSAELESPFGARLKGTGGGVTTVDGRILKMKVKYFVDDYFYVSVTPSVLGASVEPLRLDKHSNWRELLPDLRAVPRKNGGFVNDKDIADSLKVIQQLDKETAVCAPRDLVIASPLLSDELEATFKASVEYSPKADALVFVGKCVPNTL